MYHEWQHNNYLISTDKQKLHLKTAHHLISNTYWAQGISYERMLRSIEHSLCFGIYLLNENNDIVQQVGIARITTDYSSIAYLSDVVIDEAFRGQGLSKWLIDVIITHPDLQGLRRWFLATKDAHGLYQKYAGFTPLNAPESYLERFFPNAYLES